MAGYFGGVPALEHSEAFEDSPRLFTLSSEVRSHGSIVSVVVVLRSRLALMLASLAARP